LLDIPLTGEYTWLDWGVAMAPLAPTGCRQDMAVISHRQLEAFSRAFGETITNGVVVSF